MKTTGSLHSAVSSLQQVIADSAAAGAKTPEAVKQQAAKADFPYPELAAQVFKFLQARPNAPLAKGLGADDISDAFMTLLMDADSVKKLGAGKAKNPWLQVRSILRQTGMNVGSSLLEVYNTVRQTGLGYAPSILQLAGKLGELFAKLGPKGDAAALRDLGRALGLSPWQIALAAAWMKRRKKDEDLPTDADLEEIFADEELMQELLQTEGPWAVYTAQAQTLRTLRRFGESLEELAEAVE